MTFRINDGPLAGTEGDKVQSRVIRERLMREAEGNVAITVEDIPGEAEAFKVSGRGELQLAVLIETMRREGFELTVGRPQVVTRTGEDGTRLEPVEEVIIDVDEEYAGTVVKKISERRMNRIFHAWEPWKGEMPRRAAGSMIANSDGRAVAYALWNLEERGPLFVSPGDLVYRGMIVGEHTKGQDLEVNVLKGKKLTNIRAAGKDDAIQLTPPVKMTLERALSYIADDELVEVTPQSVRLRKRILDPHERKKASRAAK